MGAAGAGSGATPFWSGTLFLKISGCDDVALRAEFVELSGYEPPQGTIQIDACPAFREGGRTRWLLSEDPDDVRDGLWIWGLFKEPLYPFILFELELDAGCRLPDGSELPGGVYYFQGDHVREDGVGSALSSGKICRRVGVDVPLPGSSATYMEPILVGSYVARRERAPAGGVDSDAQAA
jgi:hypothetical protein